MCCGGYCVPLVTRPADGSDLAVPSPLPEVPFDKESNALGSSCEVEFGAGATEANTSQLKSKLLTGAPDVLQSNVLHWQMAGQVDAHR